VTQLYRDICREMPRILNQYDMDLTPVEGRAAIQHHFRRFASLQDPRAINMMVSRGYMELDETLQQYKQRPHVLRILKPYHHDEERPSDFLTKCVFVVVAQRRSLCLVYRSSAACKSSHAHHMLLSPTLTPSHARTFPPHTSTDSSRERHDSQQQRQSCILLASTLNLYGSPIG
jgi:hypothetical protein